MKIKNFFKLNNLISPHKRAEYIAFVASLFASLYHFCVFVIFYFLGLKFMFYYNIISCIIFPVITYRVPRAKHYIGLYAITVTEVIIHQILANYFLSTMAGFHFFILLMGLLPFLVFEGKYRLAIPYTIIACLLFIILEAIQFPGTFYCENLDKVVLVFRTVNVSFTIITIVIVILVYTYIANTNESLLNRMYKHLNEELNLAARIQQNFFKQEKIDFKDWEISCYSKPLAAVSGDFYDIYHEDDKLLGYALMDVSGHGISAGLVTMLVKNIIGGEFFYYKNLKLNEIMDIINERVISDKGNIDNYLTGLLVRINASTIELVNAGHPHPVLYKKEKNTVELVNKPSDAYGAIGISAFPSSYVSQFLEMESGDELIFYTDGITETLNQERKQYGNERLLKIVKRNAMLDLNQQIKLIVDDVINFANGREADDDVTIVVLRRR